MKQVKRHEPAPALERGLQILELLAAHGQMSLEQLTRHCGWPKSSVRRCLLSLEHLGAASYDAATALWHARKVLQTRYGYGQAIPLRFHRMLSVLAEQVLLTAELYRMDATGMVLVDRAEPEAGTVCVRARVGYERDLSELDSTSLVYHAFVTKTPCVRSYWRWQGGCRMALGTVVVERSIQKTQQEGIACDQDFNLHGIRRFTCPCFEKGQALAAISLAQNQSPLAVEETEHLMATLKQHLA